MLYFLLAKVTAIRPLVESDLNSEETFLIYFYDNREGYSCDLCKHFDDTVQALRSIDVRGVNYTENQEMFVLFLLRYVPYFIVRSKRQSYIVEPKDKDDLISIIEEQKWRKDPPLKWYFEPTSSGMRFIARFVLASRELNDFMHSYLQYVPKYVIYIIYGIIFGYLIFSIKGIVSEIISDVKKKTE